MLLRLVLALENETIQKQLEEYFSESDIQLINCGKMSSPWQELARSCGDIFILDETLIPKPAESGIGLLNSLPEKPTTIVIHDSESPEKQAQLVAAGADVVLFSGILTENLLEAIESTLESRRQLAMMDRFDRKGRMKPKISDFSSKSEFMQMFIEDVHQIIPGNSQLLILGETGVGKEHLAKAIHAESPRSAGPFIAINTAALPDQLLESELFGHEKGAFTGAARNRRGAFELAHGGTIFLDEIGEMALHLQAKMLRVLQDYEFTPVGGEKPVWVDVRVIAATNKNLEEEVTKGTFRQDLYYRLGVVTLTIPPLRNRKEDIPAMANHFVNMIKIKIGKEVKRISKPAMLALCRYSWPGNIRELMNVIERAIILSKTTEITIDDLPAVFKESDANREITFGHEGTAPESWETKTLPEVQKEVLDQVEKKYLEMVLQKTGGRVGEAAKIAGIHPRGFYNKMRHAGLKKEDFKTKTAEKTKNP